MKQGRDTTQEERVQIAALAASDTQKIRSISPKIFEKWLTDVTEFKRYEGTKVHKLYLKPIGVQNT